MSKYLKNAVSVAASVAMIGGVISPAYANAVGEKHSLTMTRVNVLPLLEQDGNDPLSGTINPGSYRLSTTFEAPNVEAGQNERFCFESSAQSDSISNKKDLHLTLPVQDLKDNKDPDHVVGTIRSVYDSSADAHCIDINFTESYDNVNVSNISDLSLARESLIEGNRKLLSYNANVNPGTRTNPSGINWTPKFENEKLARMYCGEVLNTQTVDLQRKIILHEQFWGRQIHFANLPGDQRPHEFTYDGNKMTVDLRLGDTNTARFTMPSEWSNGIGSPTIVVNGEKVPLDAPGVNIIEATKDHLHIEYTLTPEQKQKASKVSGDYPDKEITPYNVFRVFTISPYLGQVSENVRVPGSSIDFQDNAHVRLLEEGAQKDDASGIYFFEDSDQGCHVTRFRSGEETSYPVLSPLPDHGSRFYGERAILDGPLDNTRFTVTYPDSEVTNAKSVDVKTVQDLTESGGRISLISGETPDWISVKDAGKGVLTLAPSEGNNEGLVLDQRKSFPVLVTYPDGSTSRVDVPVTYRNYNPANYAYEDELIKGLDEEQSVYRSGLANDSRDIVWSNDSENSAHLPDWLTLDPDSGLISTAESFKNIELGEYHYFVRMTPANGPAQDVPVDITVIESMATSSPFIMRGTRVLQGDTARTPKPDADPTAIASFGVEFEQCEGKPLPDWVTLDNEPGYSPEDPAANRGTLVVNPDSSVEPGVHDMCVRVTYDDGSQGEQTVPITVLGIPSYGSGPSVRQTESGKVPKPSGADDVKSFKRCDSTPEWVKTVNKDGSLVIEPTKAVKLGKQDICVLADYGDGITKEVNAHATVTKAPPHTELYDPAYKKGLTVQQGNSIEIPKPVSDPAVPSGTAFKRCESETTPAGVTVKEDGSITFATDGSTAVGSHDICVTVMYPDNTTEDITATVRVTSNMALTDNPAYGDEVPVTQGKKAKINKPSGADNVKRFEACDSGTPTWSTIDEDTGAIALAPDYDAAVGSTNICVKVTYKDDTSEEITAKAKVISNNKGKYQPAYPDNTEVQAGHDKTIPAPVSDPALPEGTKFKKCEGTDLPEYVTVKADGSIVLNPEASVDATDLNVCVTVTYPDKTSENINAPVSVKSNNAGKYQPGYSSDNKVKRSETLEIPSPTGGPFPDGTEFKACSEGNPEWIAVNSDGSLSASPGSEVELKIHQACVMVDYPDGTSERIEVPVEVLPNYVDESDISYPGDHSVEQGSGITIKPDGTYPDGTKFSKCESAVGDFEVVGDGTVTIKPALDAEVGTHEVCVTATFPDGTHKDITTPYEITEKPRPAYEGDHGVRVGETLKIDKPSGYYPEGTKFGACEEGTPEWATVNEDGSVDLAPEDSGLVGDHTVCVTATYPNGKSDRLEIPVKVKSNQARDTELSYPAGENVDQGDVLVLKPIGDFPEGTKFGACDGHDTPEWVTIDPKTGEVTVEPGLDVKPGEYATCVTANFPDGTSKDVEFKFNVLQKPNPSYGDLEVTVGESVTTDVPSGYYPEGTKFGACEDTPEWATVGGDGRVTVAPDNTLLTGDRTVCVRAEYPNGKSEDITLKVRVNAPNLKFSGQYPFVSTSPVQAAPAQGVLARTGANVQLLMLLGMLMFLAGLAGIATRIRRRG